MASRKRGTGQSFLQREKMAVVRYCKELETEKPSTSIKEICEKAAHIFDIHSTVAFKFMKDFKINRCVTSPQNKGRAKINYNTDPAFHYIKELARRIYMYHEKGEHFTLDDLHKYAKEECQYFCGRTKLHLLNWYLALDSALLARQINSNINHICTELK